MAVEVTMPKFGLTMHEGTIQRFFKAVGESVSAGDPLYEVETEKVLYEVESPASGILAVALFEEGATVECGVAVAVIAEANEDPASLRAKYGSAPAAASSNGEVKAPKRQPPMPSRRKAPRASGGPSVRSRANSRRNSG